MAAVVVILLVLPPILHATGNDFYMRLVARAMILAIAAMGLDLILGFGGMICFGQAMFVGVGAYVVGILAYYAINGPLTLGDVAVASGTTSALIAWPAAIAVSALLGVVVGAIALRTRGLYFIMITLALAQVVYFTAFSSTQFGGSDGLPLAHASALFGLNAANGVTLYYMAFVSLSVVFVFLRLLIASRFGLLLRASSTNEQRLIMVGSRPYRYKLVAFVIAAAIAGLSGALLVNNQSFVSPSDLSWVTSGDLIVVVLLGGVGTLYGSVLGAFVFVAIEFGIGGFTEHWELLFGLLAMAIALYAKKGLIGVGGKAFSKRLAR